MNEETRNTIQALVTRFEKQSSAAELWSIAASDEGEDAKSQYHFGVEVAFSVAADALTGLLNDQPLETILVRVEA